MRLSCQEQHIPGANLLEKWEFAQAAGFNAIELRGRGDFHFRTRLPELKAARDAGVVMPTLCPEMDHFIGDFDADKRRDALENMKSILSVMAEIGGFAVTTPASWGMFSTRLPPFTPPRSQEQDRSILIDGMGELGEHAALEGVKILLEPLNRYEDHMINTVGQAADICQQVNLSSVGVVGDMFHMNIEEDDPFQSIQLVGKHLMHMQIGDSNRLQPGTGHLDFAAWINALKTAGYDGDLAMECRLRGDAQSVLPAVGKLISELLL